MKVPATLSVENLTVTYHTGNATITALREVDLEIRAGEVHGLVGESGSGKTTLALAIMQHLPSTAKIVSGSIKLEGADIAGLPPVELRELWSRQIAMVPQDPFTALNPSLRIGRQLAECFEGLSRSASTEKGLELLRMVHIPDPERVADSYPHQISGGMQQRVMIAMALCSEPKVLVLDEPTTGLDSTSEVLVIDLVRELMRDRRTATLYVSHSLGVIAQFADRLTVLYASELVESGPKLELFEQAYHPYTYGLMDSVPRLGENKRRIQLRSIGGRVPTLEMLPAACVFEPRCPVAIEVCREERPGLEDTGKTHKVRCYRWDEIRKGELDPLQSADTLPPGPTDNGSSTVLRLHDLKVRYPYRRSLTDWLRAKAPQFVRAVEGVRLTIEEGQTLGLVGESGSGKTSLARAIVGLVEPQEGKVELLGAELPRRISQRSRKSLRKVQMVLQNPDEALNPYLTIGESLARPLLSLMGKSDWESRDEVGQLLVAMRLPPEYEKRYPAQLSGGEKQRVAIARAFAAVPELVLCDEPVSSLDVSVQASILNLLSGLQRDRGTSILFISHDIAVVGFLSDQIGVLYLGQLMELAQSQDLFEPPYHPYTEALLSAIPLLDPKARQASIRLEGEVPSGLKPPSGCPFHTRCPRFLGQICVEERPPWQTDESGKRIYCHIPLEDLKNQQTRAFVMKTRMDEDW